jgi:hypothetical protein
MGRVWLAGCAHAVTYACEWVSSHPWTVGGKLMLFLQRVDEAMLLGCKTELNLNNKQKTLAAQHAGVARHGV